MTREEAIEILENWKICHYTPSREAAEVIISALNPLEIITALRPVSREWVEKVWRGEWITPTIIGGRAYNIPHCSACNGVPCGTDEHTKFCAHCGASMTDEAVKIVMERLEEMKNG